MIFKIQQKYFSVGNKFNIFDENDQPVYSAQRTKIKLLTSISLLKDGLILYNMEAKLGHIGSYFDILDGMNNFVCAIDERFSFIKWFHPAKVVKGELNIKIKSGPLHLKAYLKENGKYNKKEPIVYASKKLLKIADTYSFEVDEKRIKPELGLLIGLWYDIICFGEKH